MEANNNYNNPPAMATSTTTTNTTNNITTNTNGSESHFSQRNSKQPQQQQHLQQQQIMNGKLNRSASGSEGDAPNKNFESGKRKKSKARNATIPPNPSYPNNLDSWLEGCLRDAGAPQLSSSSEFLDYNTSSFNSTKNTNQVPNDKQSFQNFYYPGIQKTNPGLPLFPSNPLNFPNMLYRNSKLMQNDDQVEFASLPPAVNFPATGENYPTNNLDLTDPSRSFRFSDPCLAAGPSDNESKASEKISNDQPNLEKQIGNSKFLSTLLEQIKLLHETNSKICRNMQETKVEIEALKHASSWGGLRHRRDSLSGLSTHSQPMGFGFGTQSPAPTYHSGAYTPGMMTDVVREVKEAARVREEALLSRVKAMVEERSWSLGENNIRMLREIEEMKVQIQHLRGDKKEANKRITQLEAENKYIRSILASVLSNRTSEIIQENEIFRSTPIRKNLSDITRQRRPNSFSLNYGVMNHEEGLNTLLPNEKNYNQKPNQIEINKSDQIGQERRISYSKSEGHASQNGGYMNDFYMTPDNESTIDSEQRLQLQMEKDAVELRRELQEALANKKQADSKYLALERKIKRLEATASYPNDHTNKINGTTCSGESSVHHLTSNGGSNNLTQIASQIQGVSPKLSLAGPVTDL